MRGTQGLDGRFGMCAVIISGNLGGRCSFSGLRGCCLTSNCPFSTVNFAAVWNLSKLPHSPLDPLLTFSHTMLTSFPPTLFVSFAVMTCSRQLPAQCPTFPLILLPWWVCLGIFSMAMIP